jgi:DNA invertase Pin-like site-specific DNA recombinase
MMRNKILVDLLLQNGILMLIENERVKIPMGIKIAYVRVSSNDQNEERQIVELRKYGIDKWFKEKVSAKDVNRPELLKMLTILDKGDILYIESISRLARNTLDFLNIVKQLTDKGVEIVSAKENIDTSTAQGRFMLTVFGAMYEMERENIKERQAEGIAIAKSNGKHLGRPRTDVNELFMQVYKSWKNEEITAVEASKKLKISKMTYYRKVKDIENKNV